MFIEGIIFLRNIPQKAKNKSIVQILIAIKSYLFKILITSIILYKLNLNNICFVYTDDFIKTILYV